MFDCELDAYKRLTEGVTQHPAGKRQGKRDEQQADEWYFYKGKIHEQETAVNDSSAWRRFLLLFDTQKVESKQKNKERITIGTPRNKNKELPYYP